MHGPSGWRVAEAVCRDGLRIGYESSGRGSPVILLHPANATRRAWSDLGWVDALTSLGHRAVALDSRGFGGSSRVGGSEDLRPGTSSLDIAAVMDALAIESAHVCGFSLGAAQGLRFTLDQPTRVKSLVLGGLAVGPLAQVGLHLSRTAEAARAEALTQIRRSLEKASGAARAYFLAVQALLSTIDLIPLTPSTLGVPMLGVSGASDRYDPSALYRTLRDGGACIEIFSVAEAGHGTCFTHPEFRRIGTRFVAGQAGRPGSGCT